MIFFGCLLFSQGNANMGGSKAPFCGSKIVSKLNYLIICFYPLLPYCNLWLCYGIFAPCYTVLFHFLPTVQALLRAFQSCAGSKRFEKVWITNVEPGAGKGWADRFEKFEKVWKVWKVAKRVRRLFKPFKFFKPVGSPFPIFKFDICFFKHFQTCAGLKGWKGAPTSLKAL